MLAFEVSVIKKVPDSLGLGKSSGAISSTRSAKICHPIIIIQNISARTALHTTTAAQTLSDLAKVMRDVSGRVKSVCAPLFLAREQGGSDGLRGVHLASSTAQPDPAILGAAASAFAQVS